MQTDIFLETSGMPRKLNRPGHAVQKLADLAKAKLVSIHASEVTIGEWRSQMLDAARKGVDEMFNGLQAALRQDHLRKLSSIDELTKLAGKREEFIAEVTSITDQEADALIERLALTEITIAKTDAKQVFDGYFAGRPPFANAKHRPDIPDAFILQAAKNLADRTFPRQILAVCADGRLAKALSAIDRVNVVADLGALFETDDIQKSMTHLALYQAWTPKKKSQIIRFLRTGPVFAKKAIQKYVDHDLPGTEFTDDEIPVDNNVATIDGVYEPEKIEIDWKELEEFGPGWLVVPFTFEIEALLSLSVFRSDTFGMPDWIDVSIGDFERDHYFDATAYRSLRVSGWLSLQYSKDDLEQKEAGRPSEVELEEVEIRLVPLPNEYVD